MTRVQLLAVRASAAAIVAQCDAALEAQTSSPVEGPCAHPPGRRTEVPRMGAPGAWVCACGEQGDE